ncbi:hypothetical protein [Aestuariicoccus sp. MJ-SS9]|uniref:hypothetical protein n=1 Tax=Aestuariicoccus sp. MJ-SS9 TaxID=3079855 RepID=UPI00290A609D|nr:hypothetical protein [Aestuariicoccus sp. MJ-SS9]MDU8911801.1 hypothetical protein [Aestuariicoccus sp. MJ-SS9]
MTDRATPISARLKKAMGLFVSVPAAALPAAAIVGMRAANGLAPDDGSVRVKERTVGIRAEHPTTGVTIVDGKIETGVRVGITVKTPLRDNKSVRTIEIDQTTGNATPTK